MIRRPPRSPLFPSPTLFRPPDDVRARGLFPAGFLPLPHPNHPEGGMLFPTFQINEIKKQTSRDLTRFDLDFDLPDAFLPEFPADRKSTRLNSSHSQISYAVF